MSEAEDAALLAEMAKKVRRTLDPSGARIIDPADCDTGKSPMHVIRSEPNIIIIPNFLSDAEVAHLLEIAQPQWAPTLVMTAGANGNIANLKSRTSTLRTNQGAVVDYAMTPCVAGIEKKLSAVAGMDVNHLERLVMIKYEGGQQYKIHHDGNWRPITVFIYLNDLPDDDDGETFFPNLGLKIKPRKGAAIMWTNTLPTSSDGINRDEDTRVMHAGLPPKTATKYGVNCFFNAAPKRLEQHDSDFMGQGPPQACLAKAKAQGLPGRQSVPLMMPSGSSAIVPPLKMAPSRVAVPSPAVPLPATEATLSAQMRPLGFPPARRLVAP